MLYGFCCETQSSCILLLASLIAAHSIWPVMLTACDLGSSQLVQQLLSARAEVSRKYSMALKYY